MITQDKQYIVTSNGKTYRFSSDDWAARRDRFMELNPEADIAEVDRYSVDDTQDGDTIVARVDGKTYSFDKADWDNRGQSFMEKYSTADLSRVRGVDYYYDQAIATEGALEEAKKEKEAWAANRKTGMSSASLADMKMLEAGLTPISRMDDNNMAAAQAYLDEGKAIDEKIASLQQQYDNNPRVKAAREAWEKENGSQPSETLSERISKEYEAFLQSVPKASRSETMETGFDDVGLGKAIQMLTKGKEYREQQVDYDLNEPLFKQAMIYADKAEQIRNAPSVNDETNGFIKYLKGAGDRFSEVDFWSRGMSEMTALQQGGNSALAKFQKLNENFGDNLTEELIDMNLTPAEKSYILALMDKISAEAERANQFASDDVKLSKAYTRGQGTADMFGYMADFLLSGSLTGNLSKGATKAVSKWLVKNGVSRIAKSAIKGTVGKAAAKAITKNTIKGVGKILTGVASKTAGAAVDFAARTPFSLSLSGNIADRRTSMNDKGEFHGILESTGYGIFDTAIENFSESMGGAIGDVLGVPFKAGKGAWKAMTRNVDFGNLGKAAVKAGDIAQRMAKSKAWAFLKKAGFHGPIVELGEEFIGAAVRDITIEPDAWEQMANKEAALDMVIEMAPLTVLGIAGTTGQMIHVSNQAKEKAQKLRELLLKIGFKEKQVDYLVDYIRSTSADKLHRELLGVWNTMAKESGLGVNVTSSKVGEAVLEYAYATAQYQTLFGIKDAKEAQQRDAKRAELEEKYQGRFYGEDGMVRRHNLADGKTVLQLSDFAENGEAAAIDFKTGEHVTFTEADIKDKIDNEGNVLGKESLVESLDSYLSGEVMALKSDWGQARIQKERQEQIDALSQSLPESINIGTEGQPKMLAIKGHNAQGVTVVDEDGNEGTMTWESIALKLGKPIKVLTDAQIAEAEAKGIAMRANERRAARATTDAQISDAQSNIDNTNAEIEELIPNPEEEYRDPNTGEIDQDAFWEHNPEGWADYNDRVMNDGGIDTMEQIENGLAKLNKQKAELDKMAIDSPNARKAVKAKRVELQEKIDRLTALQQKYNEMFAAAEQEAIPEEERTAENTIAMREVIEGWRNQYGVPIHVYESKDEVIDAGEFAALAQIEVAETPGWSNSKGVHLFLPDIKSMDKLRETLQHELIAHQGFKLLGEKEYNALMDKIWAIMSDSAKTTFYNYPSAVSSKDLDERRRKAAEEFAAHVAEKVDLGEATAEQKSIWQRIMEFFRNLFKGQEVDSQLIANAIRQNHEALKQKAAQESVNEFKAEAQEQADNRPVPEVVQTDATQANGTNLYSTATYHSWVDNLGQEHTGTREEVLARMQNMGFSDAEIEEMAQKMDTAYAYMEKLRRLTNPDGTVRFDEFNKWAEKTPLYKQVGRDYVKAITSLVSNGDYPVNLEITTDCIKREAFTHLLNELVKRGAELSGMGPGEIVTIQKMMKQYGIEVACNLCFVEGKRLQIVNWASQIVNDWNDALIEAGVETDEFFEFGKDGDAFIPSEEWRTYEDKSKVAKVMRNLDDIALLFQGLDPKTFKAQKRKNKKALDKYIKEKAEKAKKPIDQWKPSDEQKREMKKIANEGLYPTYVNENMEEYRNAFNAMRNEWLDKNPNADPLSFNPTQKQWEALGKIRNRQIDNVRAKMVRLIMEYPEMRKKMTLNDLLGSKGLMEIRQQHGQAYADLYSIILQRFGTGTPKPVQDAVPYDGEVMTLSESAFKKANEIGGARLFSFSDFDITKVFDYMQMFFDLEANKQMLQSYTKEVAAVLIFGRSNAKFNISTLANAIVPDSVKEEYNKASEEKRQELRHKWAEYAGLEIDAEGNIVGINFSEEHSVSPAFAQQIFRDDSRNKDCGAIMVGASVNHAIFSAALQWIRMVIPFHLSGMPLVAREKTDVKWYTDNTAYQSTRKKTKDGWSKISSSEDTFKFYNDMNKEGWNMRDKTREYLAWCAEKGFRPKFDWGINSDYYRAYCEENGYTPNQQIIDIMDADTTDGVWNQYYKFLTDFTAYKPVFNEQGEMIDEIPSPQLPVQSNFDFSEMEKDVLFEGERSMLEHREGNIQRTNRHIEILAEQATAYLNGDITEEEMGLRDDVHFENTADAERYLEEVAKENGTNMYRFIGERGAANLDKAQEATIRLDNLAVARQMEEAGKDALAIKLATGWERGVDKLWRYEVPDDFDLYVLENRLQESLNDGLSKAWGIVYPSDLGELTKAYPDFNVDIMVWVGEEFENTGEYSPATEGDETTFGRSASIEVKAKTVADIKDVLVHEIQHAIQEKEGFAEGGSVFGLTDKLSAELDKRVTRIKELRAEGRDSEADELMSMSKGLAEAVINNDADTYQNYRKLAGEVEARNVSARLKMSEQERRESLLSETEDVAREDQIVLMDGLGVSEMGSRVDKRMLDIENELSGTTMTEAQKTVYNVFIGKQDKQPIAVQRKDGVPTIIMEQGADNKSGAKHAIFKHYGTGSGSFTANDVLLIPEIVNNGTRKQDGNKVVYELTKDGVRYRVVTYVKTGNEIFNNFYTNRKNQSSQQVNAQKSDTQSALASEELASADKDTNISETSNKDGNNLFKTANNKSPEFSLPNELFLDDPIMFKVSRNNRQTINSWLNKRPDLNDEAKAEVLDYLDQFNDATLQLAVGKWYAQNAIKLPEDIEKCMQAVASAKKAKIDALKFASPMEIINEYGVIEPKAKPINPDKVSTLSKVRDLSNGISIYDVEDSEESRKNMREIINTHYGKNCSPWCLLQGDENGKLTAKSQEYWRHYNGYPKQVAFKDGKLLAFSANDSEETAWWDRMDKSYSGVPVNQKIGNDKLGRTRTVEFDQETGKETKVHDIKKVVSKDGIRREWTWRSEKEDDIVRYGMFNEDEEMVEGFDRGSWNLPDFLVGLVPKNRIRFITTADGRQMRFNYFGGLTNYQSDAISFINNFRQIGLTEVWTNGYQYEFRRDGKLLYFSDVYYNAHEGKEAAPYQEQANEVWKQVQDIRKNAKSIANEMLESMEYDPIMFSTKAPYESAKAFAQGVVDEFNAKYKRTVPTAVVYANSRPMVAEGLGIPVDELPDELFKEIRQEAKSAGGANVLVARNNQDGSPITEERILIFAKDQHNKSAMIDGALFHENIHGMVRSNPALLDLGKWLFENREGMRAKIANAVEAAYPEEKHHEEMLAGYMGYMMSVGRAQEVLDMLPEEYKPLASQIYEEFGYIPEQEDSRRSDEYRRDNARLNAERDAIQQAQDQHQGEQGRNERSDNGEDVNLFKTEITPEVRSEMNTISAQAIVNGTYLKAPNGKDTNLTPEQWALVRTKNFKRWFGDWEKPQRIEKLRRSKPVVVNGDEYVGNYELNKKSAQKYIIDHLRGQYTNADTGDKIHVSNIGAQKVTSHGYNEPIHLASVMYIPRMIEEAIFITEEPNTKRKNEFETYRYYVCGLKIGGEDYTAKLVVGVSGKETYYDHDLSSIEKGKLIESRGLVPTRRTNEESTLSEVKDKRLISILKEDFSKVIDENGEPMVMHHGSAWEPLMEPKGKAVFRMNDGLLGKGAYFSNVLAEATLYAEIATGLDTTEEGNYELLQDKYVTDYFLNVRNEEDIYREGDDMVVVAKSPNQIKSATDNTGEYSEDEDIRFKTVYGGNRGYVGYSMSKRAANARSEGRYPKTDFRKEYNVTAPALDLLVYCHIIDGSEWHHTSMYGNRTTFYGWYEDEYADIYQQNKKEIDALAREFKKKTEEYRGAEKAIRARLVAGEITPQEELKLSLDADKERNQHERELQNKIDAIFNPVQPDGSGDETTLFKTRTAPAPTKTQDVYKLMRLGTDGKLYPLFIGSAEPIELGTWYDAESPNLGDLTKLASGVHLVNNETGEAMTLDEFKAQHPEINIKGKRPNVAAINWATENGARWIEIEDKSTAQRRYEGESRSYYNLGINGSGQVGQFAMRPGWHAGSLPTMRQIGKGKDKNLRDDSFVWVKGRIPADVDYQSEADANPDKDIPTHIPTDGFYMKATNANAKASQADKMGWYVAGSFVADEIISDAEARSVIDSWNAKHPDAKVEYDYPRESGREFDPNVYEMQSRMMSWLSDENKPYANKPDIRLANSPEGGRSSIIRDGKPSHGSLLSARDEYSSDNKGTNNSDTNNNSEENLFKTYGKPTEAVVDDGLRLSVEDFTKLASDIYTALPVEVRRQVVQDASRIGYDLKKATFQMVARLAEKKRMSDDEIAVAKIVADKVEKSILANGEEMTRPLTVNEALWMVYRASNPTSRYDLIGAARNSVVADNLGQLPKQKAESKRTKDDIMFKTEYVPEQAASVAEAYEKAVSYWGNRINESFVDQYDSVDHLMRAIEEATGKPAESSEDIRLALYQSASRGLAKLKEVERDLIQKMWDAVNALAKEGVSHETLSRYVILKHGLERNDIFAARDARKEYESELRDKLRRINNDSSLTEQEKEEKMDEAMQEYKDHLKDIDDKVDEKYLENRKTDYSGIKAMFADYPDLKSEDQYSTNEEYKTARRLARRLRYKNLDKAEAEAQRECDAFEMNGGNLVKNLWDSINNLTRGTLKMQQDYGMLSQESYDSLTNMFNYYVPLRGFADNTGEDLYDYYGHNVSDGYAPAIMGAKGRRSEAESPFGWMAAMAATAVISGEKNLVKQALYNFAVNRPNDLLKVSDVWYLQNPTDGKFYPEYPPKADSSKTPAENAEAYLAWENKMEGLAKQGKAVKRSNNLHVAEVVNFGKKDIPEHVIRLNVGGMEKHLIINGNPRAAQAINGLLNVETDKDYQKGFGKMLRWMSQVSTSWNPEFWITNIMRDSITAFLSTAIEEDKEYRRAFRKNWGKAWKVIKLLPQLENGTLGNGEIEDLLREAVANGVQTGYSHIKSMEEWDMQMDKYLKDLNKEESKVIHAMKTGLHAVQQFSEAMELVSRFATYMTSREMGRDIPRSVSDAKEVTVNFNRKGSGKKITIEEAKKLKWKSGKPIFSEKWTGFKRLMGLASVAYVSGISFMAPYGRRALLFFNAAIQGLNKWVRSIRKGHGGKVALTAGAVALLGFLKAVIQGLIDGDDDYQQNVSEYERRKNLMLGARGWFFKLALPQEIATFYGLGDMLYNWVSGNYHHKGIGEKIKMPFEQLFDMLPINPLGGWKEFLPSYSRAAIEAGFATPWEDYWGTGSNFMGMPLRKDMPWLTDAEKESLPKYTFAGEGTWEWLVSLSELVNDISGGTEVEKGWLQIDPARWQSWISQLTGGLGTFIGKVVNTGKYLVNHDEGDYWKISQTPFLSRILTATDERLTESLTNEQFYHYKGIAEASEMRWQKYSVAGNESARAKEEGSDEYKILQIYNESFRGNEENFAYQLKTARDENEEFSIRLQMYNNRKLFVERLEKEGLI